MEHCNSHGILSALGPFVMKAAELLGGLYYRVEIGFPHSWTGSFLLRVARFMLWLGKSLQVSPVVHSTARL
jgi:hypothetical protein